MTDSVTRVLVGVRTLAFAACLPACDFERAASSEVGMNSCVTDAECTDDTRCQEGMCVARSVEDPLAVALQVVLPGADAESILLDRFVVEGPITRDWALPKAVDVSGDIKDADGGPVEAEVRFVPIDATRGVPTGAVVASTAASDPAGHYFVKLLPDVDYRMEVQPAARELPPMRQEVHVTGPDLINVEYPNDLKTRDFEVRVAPEGESLEGKALLVRAFDSDTGELVSSTATVQDSHVTLVLTPDASGLRIELSVEESYQDLASRGAPASCDKSAPVFPTLSIDESDLQHKGVLELPAYPTRIVYEGTVELCPGAVSTEIGSLPIALRSTDLQFDDTDTLFASSFAATTTAEMDASQLRFCVEVVPGTYEVVVTPPSSMACAIFAETRLVSAPDGKMATGALFELPGPAYLSGTLLTTDGTPLADATIEAQALGRSEGVQLAQDDPSVTQYNRSTQTTSSDEGVFELPVDLGGYDVVVKPPADSGFPWLVLHDVNIGAPKAFPNEIRVASPVRIDGALRYAGNGPGAALEGAEVRAFAVIDDEFDTERAVPIGKAVADADGHFMLLLSPSTRKGW